MTSTQAIVDVATFVISIGVSAFIAGSRWGGLQQDMRAISDRLAKIEGMFELRLRQEENK